MDFFRDNALASSLNRKVDVKIPVQRVMNGVVDYGYFVVDGYKDHGSGVVGANGRVELGSTGTIYATEQTVEAARDLALKSWLKRQRNQ